MIGADLVEYRADRAHHLEVGPFRVAADVIGFAGAASLENQTNRRAVIADIQPVADVLPVTVYRQRFSLNGVEDYERDKLFRELERPVIFRAVGGKHRQAIRMVPRPNEMIRARFGRGVGTVGLVVVVFGEGWICRPERAVDLVGGHMQKTERLLLTCRQCLPVVAYGFKQPERSRKVGFDKLARAVDGAVHMALGGEVEHCTRAILSEQLRYDRRIANIAFEEDVLPVAAERRQISKVAGVSELVKVYDGFPDIGNPLDYEVCADKPGAAGNKNGRFGTVHRSGDFTATPEILLGVRVDS